MLRGDSANFFESSVFLIDIYVVFLRKIIGYDNVRPGVIVQVSERKTQSKSDLIPAALVTS